MGDAMAEPTTTVTDYLLAVLALVLGLRLAWAARLGHDPSLWWWALGFLALAVGAALGGTSHGFGPRLTSLDQRRLWTATLMVLVAGNAALSMAVVTMALDGPARRLLLAAVAAVFVLGIAAVSVRPVYRVVIVDSALALVGVVALALWASGHGPAPWAVWVLAGAGVAATAAMVQALQIAPHAHFNHNDLYHVLQALACLLFYRAAVTPGS
jgi:hypothetical protein